MVRVYAQAIPYRVGLVRRESFAGLIIFFCIPLFAALAIYLLSPPRAVPASAPDGEFSSERAGRHLQVLARDPHPMGTIEAAKVRDYLVSELTAMGLDASVQRATAVNRRWGAPFNAGTVENVVARLQGSDGPASALLVAHYDSVPGSNGASDNGAAVAALLETARALKAGPPLRNDLIFLFTDGEEAGLLGARAFVDEHPWASSVAVALNFEARGNGGPVVMFETSDGNGELVRALAEAAPRPVASSLSQEVYKLMPNDTDLSVFKEAGFRSLNFAYIDGITHYHTPLDSFRNVNESSLQHHGSYALSMARHFGGANLEGKERDDAVYFNALGPLFIRYSTRWVTPLSLLTVLLFATTVAVGFKRRLLTVAGVLLGSLALIISVAGSVLMAVFAWWIVRRFESGYDLVPHGQADDGHIYMISFALLALAVTSATYNLFRRKISPHDLTSGALAVWVVLMAASNLYLPGASYLFHWPLLFTTAAVALWFASSAGERVGTATALTLTAGSIPTVILLSPIIYLVFVALTLKLTSVGVGLVALSVGLLAPHLAMAGRRNGWLVSGASAAIGVSLIVMAALSFEFRGDNPKPNTIFYAMNADSGKAVWASVDSSPDEWTSQFFTSSVERGDLNEYVPSSFSRFLKGAASAAQLAGPEITLIEDAAEGELRVTRMRIASPRKAPAISVTVDPESEVVGAWVNGKEVGQSPGKRWGLKYHNVPDDGIELILKTNTFGPLRLRAVDISYGLPHMPGSQFLPRPAHMMAALFPYSDTTLVSRSFTFNP